VVELDGGGDANVYETPYPTANEWNTTVPQAGDQGACDAQSGSSFPPPPLEPAAVQASGPQSGWPACGDFVAYYIPSAAVRQGALTDSGANVVVQPPPLPALSSVIHVLAQHLGDPAYKELRDWANAQIGVPGATTPAGPQRVEIPQPQTNETYDDYAARLDDLGLTHHTRHTLGADTADLDQPADAVTVVTPAPGMSVLPNTTLTVDANPSAADMPEPTQREIDLATALDSQNENVDETNKLDIARSCLELEDAAGNNGDDDCKTLPIFVSGNDVREAADHDLAALGAISDPDMTNQTVNPGWVQLNYRPAVENPTPRSWKDSRWPCSSPRPEGDQCDEYPFYASLQGGGAATPLPNLKYINGAQNGWQGTMYSSFLSTCQIADGEPFLAIPLPSALRTDSMSVCNR
jgi:hypothetical protein